MAIRYVTPEQLLKTKGSVVHFGNPYRMPSKPASATSKDGVAQPRPEAKGK